MSTIVTAIQAINHFFENRYPTLILIGVMIFAFIELGSLDIRLTHVEKTEFPLIRSDIKEIRTDISDLKTRMTRVEVKLDDLAEDVKEMKADIKILLQRK